MTDREIDCLVAEHIMGFTWRESKTGEGDIFLVPHQGFVNLGQISDLFQPLKTFHVPFFCTDIYNVVQTVISKMKEKGFDFSLQMNKGTTTVSFSYSPRYDAGEEYKYATIVGTGNPNKLICLAALKALGVEVNG